MLQWRYDMESVLDVPPEAFDPPPRVDSAVVRMQPLRAAGRGRRTLLSELVTVAFSQRRKLLRHTLGRWLEARGAGAGFDVQRRAEEVPVARVPGAGAARAVASTEGTGPYQAWAVERVLSASVISATDCSGPGPRRRPAGSRCARAAVVAPAPQLRGPESSTILRTRSVRGLMHHRFDRRLVVPHVHQRGKGRPLAGQRMRQLEHHAVARRQPRMVAAEAEQHTHRRIGVLGLRQVGAVDQAVDPPREGDAANAVGRPRPWSAGTPVTRR
jgi:hypothetical protein